jgi:hypothetical protein
MAKQTATELLKAKIADLEIKQAEEGKAFREELMSTYESLKPVNLIKSSIKDFTSSAELKKTLFEAVVVLVNGLITKTLISSSKGNPLLKLLTTLMQLGVTNLIANHRDDIFQFVKKWSDKLFSTATDKDAEFGAFCE